MPTSKTPPHIPIQFTGVGSEQTRRRAAVAPAAVVLGTVSAQRVPPAGAQIELPRVFSASADEDRTLWPLRRPGSRPQPPSRSPATLALPHGYNMVHGGLEQPTSEHLLRGPPYRGYSVRRTWCPGSGQDSVCPTETPACQKTEKYYRDSAGERMTLSSSLRNTCSRGRGRWLLPLSWVAAHCCCCCDSHHPEEPEVP